MDFFFHFRIRRGQRRHLIFSRLLNFPNGCRYLYIYYLPSGLFVVVSWVSFLIPPEVVPGRMALLVTLFLVLTNIFNTITNVSPNVEGMTAIASWMIACMFFVFLALLEYATILYFQLVSQRSKVMSDFDGGF